MLEFKSLEEINLNAFVYTFSYNDASKLNYGDEVKVLVQHKRFLIHDKYIIKAERFIISMLVNVNVIPRIVNCNETNGEFLYNSVLEFVKENTL
jgi:hypothetical protein